MLRFTARTPFRTLSSLVDAPPTMVASKSLSLHINTPQALDVELISKLLNDNTNMNSKQERKALRRIVLQQGQYLENLIQAVNNETQTRNYASELKKLGSQMHKVLGSQQTASLANESQILSVLLSPRIDKKYHTVLVSLLNKALYSGNLEGFYKLLEIHSLQKKQTPLVLPIETHEKAVDLCTDDFMHYYNLVRFGVYLSVGPLRRMRNRLLNRSKIERDLVTLQSFVINGQEHVHSLKSFEELVRDAKHVIRHMDSNSSTTGLEKMLQILYKRSTDSKLLVETIAYYLCKTKRFDKLPEMITFMTPKLYHTILLALRRQGHYEECFKLINLCDELFPNGSLSFKRVVVNELITNLRQFDTHEPNIAIAYICSIYTDPRTKSLLQDLGLLEGDYVMDAPVKEYFHINTLPPLEVLTELYMMILPRSEVLPMFEKFLSITKYYPKIDDGILNVFLHQIKYAKKDYRMSLHFLEQAISSIPMYLSAKPFSLVLYKNMRLTSTEVQQVLLLMDQKKVPLDYMCIVSLVLRNIRLNNIEEAHSWYQKLLQVGFPLKHMVLIQQVLQLGWELPKDFDAESLPPFRDPKELPDEEELILDEYLSTESSLSDKLVTLVEKHL